MLGTRRLFLCEQRRSRTQSQHHSTGAEHEETHRSESHARSLLQSASAISLSNLPEADHCRTLGAMEVHFTPEQEAQLAQVAANAGADAERLVKEVALRLLQSNAGPSAVPPGSIVAEMRALRARVKPDPEGWTTRDYVNYGRRLF